MWLTQVQLDHSLDLLQLLPPYSPDLNPIEQSFAAVAASTMTDLLTVPSRAFSIQQTRGQRGDQVWSQWNRAPPRGRSGPPRIRETHGRTGGCAAAAGR